MQFSIFCEHLSRIEKTRLRLEITKELAELFKKLEPKEIVPCSWLLLGRLVPKYESLELNFAEKMMMRVLSGFITGNGKKTTSTLGQGGLFSDDLDDGNVMQVKEMYKKSGDLGDVAGALLGDTKDTRNLVDVYGALMEIAKSQGTGSQDVKLKLMSGLLRNSDSITAKYIVRIALSTLRLGFSDMTILDALSWAKTGDKSLRVPLELAYQLRADIGKLAFDFLTGGEKMLEKIEVELGVPIAPALGQRLNSAQEMIEKMGKVIVEPKYDGTRVLIHIKKHGKDWQIRTFTRNLEETSGMFPELRGALDQLDADEIILDSEAMGYDAESDKLLTFQHTIRRKRKHQVTEMAQELPLRFFVFDVLYKDGRSMLREPLFKRKELLQKLVEKGSTFVVAPYIVTESADELREYHKTQLAAGLEGAMIKKYDGVYQPGRRGWSWVKFKEVEGTKGKLSDTLDCIVMGYYVGQGKRTGFGVGAFLVGVRDEKSDQIKTIAKIGTGLSDEQWKELRTRCDAIATSSTPESYLVHPQLEPDVWVIPKLVVEIAADELTNSPIHTAEKALRFPRLVRFRDDKNAEQATSISELAQIG